MYVLKCVTKVAKHLEDRKVMSLNGKESGAGNVPNFRLHCTIRNVGRAVVLCGVSWVGEVMTKNQVLVFSE